MMRRLVVATLMLSMVLLGLPMTGGSQGVTADQYFQYANRLYQAKDYTNAVKYYQAAVQVNPNNAQAYQVLGNCLLLTNRKAEAVAAYEKALALNPNNPQLAAYVQNLKNQLGTTAPAAQTATAAAAQTAPAAATAEPAAANPGMQYLSQGGALFQQKQFAASIPYFQQAAQLMPTDYRASYYLAYAQYMNRDMKNAAVNFYLANQKQPNATLKAYADRIKASLPPADQQWVDAQAAGPSTATTTVATRGHKVKPKQFGIRALAGLAFAALKDFNDEADFQTSYATKQGYGLTGQVPKSNLWIGGEPFYQPIPAAEVAVGFGIFPVGSYSYTASGWTAITNGAPGYGTPSTGTYPGDTADIIRNEFKISTSQVSLTARFYAGGPKAKGFLGVGLGVYPASVAWNRTIASGLGDPTIDDSYTGTFKKTGIGEHVMLGGSFRLGNNVRLEPYLMYRLAKISGLTGTIVDNHGNGTTGPLTVYSGPKGEKVIAVDGGNNTLPTGWTSKALELDLSGIQAGLGISIFF